MSSTDDRTAPHTEDDPRLVRAVQEYLGALEAGNRPDRRALAGRYPDLAEAMAPYLDALDLMHGAEALRAAPEPDVAAAPLGAEPLGDFRILREVGRGGMGVVYEATQLSLGRRVALKVLPLAATLDTKHLQRFHREAQAAAQLHHTNIVPVYAVGCERGVHFYAMQLIEGQSLAAVIAQLRREAGRPEDESIGRTESQAAPAGAIRAGRPLGAGLDPEADTARRLTASLTTQRSERGGKFYRTAARLIAQAADALEHAHQFGIVHRDVKPANLLVDAHGRLWVTDFGLAQFHADAALTRTGDLVGTLRYMSPEQASGRRVLLDHRTDVYSLGATLYELVTLEPIFPGQTSHDLLRQIIHDEPRAPRAHDRAIPIELETIILKAAAKTPAERYGSARELAEDLRRFLDDRPILAKRPSLAERARKWSRRHPSIVAAALLLLLVCVAALLVNNWMITGEQARTKSALEREQRRAEEAEERFRLARRSVDEMIRLDEEELADRPGLENLRRRMLMSALVFYQEFIAQREGDPHAQAELRETKARVERILADLAVLQGAGQLHLLGQASVLDDLKFSPEQREEVINLTRDLRQRGAAMFREFGKLSHEERRARFLEQARADDAAITAALTPQQVQRLRQVALQTRGVAAFREAAVINELKLTAEQRRRLRSIEAETFFAPHERKGPGPGDRKGPGPGDRKGPGPSADFRRAYEQRQRAAMERALATLTPQQLQTWRTLIGPPFEGPLPYGPPFGPFGPPR